MRLERIAVVILHDVRDLRPWTGMLATFPRACTKIMRNRGFDNWRDYELAMEKEDHVKQHCVEKMIRVIRSRLGNLCVLRQMKPPLFAGDTNHGDACDDPRRKYNIYTPELQNMLNRINIPYHPRREFYKTSAIMQSTGCEQTIPNEILTKIISITRITVFTETEKSNCNCKLSVICNGTTLVEKDVEVVKGVAQTELFNDKVGIYGRPWNFFAQISIKCSTPMSSIIFTGWKAMSPDEETQSMQHAGPTLLPYHIPKPCPPTIIPDFEEFGPPNDRDIRNHHAHEDGVCYNIMFVAGGTMVNRYT